ncbi:WhiB family transcriptional regulator [Actinomadura sp. 9N215]|uniref:WhiB family transcriptional regulator n=1 Tax=Actinomadura sp. 9N215 TaxID=3375150 RepID=UPI003794129B
MFDYPRFDLDDDPPECVNEPDIFFPPALHPLGVDEARAKQICGRCRYRKQCRDYATHHGETGIWGGTNDTERATGTDATQDPPRHGTRRISRYTLYEVTQMMISRDGLTVRECAERLGLSYDHVNATRRTVMREIAAGQWRPSTRSGAR